MVTTRVISKSVTREFTFGTEEETEMFNSQAWFIFKDIKEMLESIGIRDVSIEEKQINQGFLLTVRQGPED